jgi:hypothetical protein
MNPQAMARYAAFLSYARSDDNKRDGAWISELKTALEVALRALSGKEISIWQDVDGIVWGERFERKIVSSADDAVFLIPIVTPSYFESEYCRKELEQFIEREKTERFKDLILPIYYIKALQVEGSPPYDSDYAGRLVREHKYEDFRSLRHRSLASYEAKTKIDGLASALLSRLDDYARRQLSSPTMEAAFTDPPNEKRVSRYP